MHLMEKFYWALTTLDQKTEENIIQKNVLENFYNSMDLKIGRLFPYLNTIFHLNLIHNIHVFLIKMQKHIWYVLLHMEMLFCFLVMIFHLEENKILIKLLMLYVCDDAIHGSWKKENDMMSIFHYIYEIKQ